MVSYSCYLSNFRLCPWFHWLGNRNVSWFCRNSVQGSQMHWYDTLFTCNNSIVGWQTSEANEGTQVPDLLEYVSLLHWLMVMEQSF